MSIIAEVFGYAVTFVVGFAAGWGWSRLKPAQRAAVTDTIASGADAVQKKATDAIKSKLG